MRKLLPGLLGLLILTMSAGAAADGYYRKYEVTITNITRGQTFTPQLVVTHSRKVALFELGKPAGLPLEILAEDGNTAPLTDALLGQPYEVSDVQTIPGLLGPGETTSITVEATRFHSRLSLAAMLIPTNDTFVALDSVPLSRKGRTVMVPAYDAGSEINDETCANIPGPTCGGAGASPGSGEGYVHISNGIHGVGDLEPAVYDWRNTVARVTVKRVKHDD